MARKLRPDRTLFFVTLILLFLGIAMVFSSSAVTAQEKQGDPNHFFVKQLIAGAVGLAAMFAVMRVDYHAYQRPVVVFTIVAVVVSLLVLVFFAPSTANTQRWLSLPGFNFQPSELAKLALILFLAYSLDRRRESVNHPATLMPIVVLVGLMAGLVLIQPDLGTAASLVILAMVVLFVAGLRLHWIGIAALASLPLLYFFVYLVPWRWSRVVVFFDPWRDPLGRGFQIIQSLISVGAGGVSGLGFMEGKQKLFFLPEAHTDFIFAVVGEELGLIGTAIVLLLFLVFFWRGIRSSMRAPDAFGFYLAFGITVMIAVQAFLNISVVLGLLPTKGIPLPFLSYGGSSLIVMLASVGILLNVSQQGS